MFLIRMNRVVVDDFAVHGGDEIAVVSDGTDRNDVQIEIITAVFVNGQQSQGVAQIVDVVRASSPIGAVIPMIHQRPGYVLAHVEADKLDVGVVFNECL